MPVRSVSVLVTLVVLAFALINAIQCAKLYSTKRNSLETKIKSFLRDSNDKSSDEEEAGTRWAVLIAGSSGFYNYRHQADVCHAYQLLKKGGLRDENIVVFMFDDIAEDPANPRPGTIMNRPDGPDVYKGVPKDYTGSHVNRHNVQAAILGNRSAINGGSGKVIESKPNDHIFIFFSDHGASGVLCMPEGDDYYSDDVIATLKQKYEQANYKTILFYVEACFAGSVFAGYVPSKWNVYVETAANEHESSYATYCPSSDEDYDVCLGDLFSVSWMEDTEKHDRKRETLEQQYLMVKNRTLASESGSHVKQYGDLAITSDHLDLFMGAKSSKTSVDNAEQPSNNNDEKAPATSGGWNTVKQYDADLVYFWRRYLKEASGSDKKFKALEELNAVLSHRLHVDRSMRQISEKIASSIKNSIKLASALNRPEDKPLVDDWDCLKTMVKTFERHCGLLGQYGKQHTRSLANLCNAGISTESMDTVAHQVCPEIPNNKWSLA